MISDRDKSGIGMTSARTRERLIERLRAQGVRHPGVLDQIRSVPRHLFGPGRDGTLLQLGHAGALLEQALLQLDDEHAQGSAWRSSGLPGWSKLTSSGRRTGRFFFFSGTTPQLSQWTTGIGQPQ